MRSEYTPKTTNLLHRTYNRLTAIGFVSKRKGKSAQWLWRCLCGKLTIASFYNVSSGHTTSCGCFNQECRLARAVHGMGGTPEYSSWHNMMKRCLNSNDTHYADYGGRGITVCEHLKIFANFFAVIGKRTPKWTLDRKDNNGNYSCGQCEECTANGWPLNIRWATQAKQARNKRQNRWITLNGETLCVADWADRLDIGRGMLRYRLKHWPLEKVLAELEKLLPR